MSYSPTDLKKGIVIQIDSRPYRVTEYSQKVMGRGGSIVNVKLKNLLDGSVIPKTFKGADKIEPASVSTKTVQFLYADTQLHFMNPETYEQFSISKDTSENALDFLKEGDSVGLQFFEGNVINLELDKNVYLEVTYAEDVVKGDTANAITKNATVETGLTVKVPAFIKTGDIISVSTEDGSYRERKK